MGRPLKSINPKWIYITTIITVGIATALYLFELRLFSGLVIGLAIWQIRQIISRSLAYYDRVTQDQIKQIEETVRREIEVKPSITEEARNAVKDLWEQAVWLGRNFRVLWPGVDEGENIRQEYISRLKGYEEYLVRNSILLLESIMDPANRITGAIREYQAGKDLRWNPPYSQETSREGGKMMTAGAKSLNKAIRDLLTAIRQYYGLEERFHTND